MTLWTPIFSVVIVFGGICVYAIGEPPDEEELEDGHVPLLRMAIDGDYEYHENKPFLLQKLPPFSFIDGLTVTLWVLPLRFMETNEIITLIASTDTTGITSRLYLNKKKLAGIFEGSSFSASPPALEWSFIGIVCNGTYIFVYFNDILIKTTELAFDFSLFQSNTILAIGADGATYNPFSGYLADIRIYNTALEKEDIVVLYTVGYLDSENIIEYQTIRDPSKPNIARNVTGKIFSGPGTEDDEFSIILSRNLRSSIEFDIIPIHMLLYRPKEDSFIIIPESMNFTEAQSVCKQFNGKLPGESSEAQEEIVNYFYANNIEVPSFWIDKARTLGKCHIAYTGQFRSSKVKCSALNNFICQIKRNNEYRILGYNDTTDYTFRLAYLESGLAFNSLNKYTIRLNDNNMIFSSFDNPRREMTRKLDTYKNIFGRHLWTIMHGGPESKYYVEMTLTSCTTDQFTCDSGMCTHIDDVCNVNFDCFDASDEGICNPAITPDTDTYLKSYAPSYGSQDKTPVDATLSLMRFIKLDLTENKLNIALTLTASWFDSRLKFKFVFPWDKKTISKENSINYWLPKIKMDGVTYDIEDKFSILDNRKDLSVSSFTNGYKTIQGSFEAVLTNGEDVLLTHTSTEDITLTCPMDLLYFPFDIQTCTMQMILMGQMYEDAKWGDLQAEIHSKVTTNLFEIVRFTFEISKYNDTIAIVTLVIKRKYGAYILNTFLPCIILEFIGLLTAIFPIQDFTNRMTVTLSCLIVMAALFTQVSSTLPESAAPKFIDIWLFFHVWILFMLFFIHVLVNYMLEKQLRKVHASLSRGEKNRKWKTMQAFLQLDKIHLDGPPDPDTIDATLPKLPARSLSMIYKVNYGGTLLCLILYVIFCIAFSQISPTE